MQKGKDKNADVHQMGRAKGHGMINKYVYAEYFWSLQTQSEHAPDCMLWVEHLPCAYLCVQRCCPGSGEPGAVTQVSRNQWIAGVGPQGTGRIWNLIGPRSAPLLLLKLGDFLVVDQAASARQRGDPETWRVSGGFLTCFLMNVSAKPRVRSLQGAAACMEMYSAGVTKQALSAARSAPRGSKTWMETASQEGERVFHWL